MTYEPQKKIELLFKEHVSLGATPVAPEDTATLQPQPLKKFEVIFAKPRPPCPEPVIETPQPAAPIAESRPTVAKQTQQRPDTLDERLDAAIDAFNRSRALEEDEEEKAIILLNALTAFSGKDRRISAARKVTEQAINPALYEADRNPHLSYDDEIGPRAALPDGQGSPIERLSLYLYNNAPDVFFEAHIRSHIDQYDEQYTSFHFTHYLWTYGADDTSSLQKRWIYTFVADDLKRLQCIFDMIDSRKMGIDDPQSFTEKTPKILVHLAEAFPEDFQNQTILYNTALFRKELSYTRYTQDPITTKIIQTVHNNPASILSVLSHLDYSIVGTFLAEGLRQANPSAFFTYKINLDSQKNCYTPRSSIQRFYEVILPHHIMKANETRLSNMYADFQGTLVDTNLHEVPDALMERCFLTILPQHIMALAKYNNAFSATSAGLTHNPELQEMMNKRLKDKEAFHAKILRPFGDYSYDWARQIVSEIKDKGITGEALQDLCRDFTSEDYLLKNTNADYVKNVQKDLPRLKALDKAQQPATTSQIKSFIKKLLP